MGIGFVFLIIIWLVFILISLCFLIYFIKNKKMFGIIMSSASFLFLISFYFINEIEELQFNKEDVKTDLKSLNIILKNDFEIIDNKISGMPESNQETKIQISKVDAEKIINEIKSSNNFITLKSTEDISNDFEKEGRYTNKKILNYQYPDFYSKEIYKEVNNLPTRFFLYIEENNDTLTYKKFED